MNKNHPLTYKALKDWTERQQPLSIVGVSKRGYECPCSQCMTDIGIVPAESSPKTVFVGVDYTDIDYPIAVGGGHMWYENPAWLKGVVRDVDALEGAAPITRETLLDILNKLPERP